jgi:hypothetical protein
MSKQYKLIKKLPFEFSPEIGYISKPTKEKDGAHYWNKNWFHPEKYPEFWEEVVEKDYEIITVLKPYVNSKYILIKNKSFGISYVGDVYYYNGSSIRGFDMMDNIKNSNWKIHSVKRLSDSEVFTVGNNTNAGIIKEFSIHGSKLQLKVDGLIFLDDFLVKKIKKPLFTTEDGVDIFEGGCFYSVCKQDLRITSDEPINEVSIIGPNRIWDGSDGYLQFSTKEKAEEYILLNKPLNLSIQDLINIQNKYGTLGDSLIEKVKESVKSKLCK